jgi:ubiquinone/menaquinone biosynthesis C-methylase UbiE/uncharacterized protein YbaR (Trm112 family)
MSGTVTRDVGENLSPLLSLLRCLDCRADLEIVRLIAPGAYPNLGPDGQLRCLGCERIYPIVGGTARMLPPEQLAKLADQYPKATAALDDGLVAGVVSSQQGPDEERDIRQRTADSFAYEWKQFGGLRDEWRKNFLDYMQPLDPSWFDGKLVLDAGGGSGRHSFHASQLGARVAIVDFGRAIDVARQNLPKSVLTVQADVEYLPFDHQQFDMVACIGVLPCVPDPERTFKRLVPFARPGGRVHIYAYWIPPKRWHQRILEGVTATRHVTTRMPHWLLHALCYPIAGVLYTLVVIPYKIARSRPMLARLADQLPLKTYADYPFGVCVNDQFDRLSAPIENRHSREEVKSWYDAAGLEEVAVIPNHGWVGDGRRPQADHRVSGSSKSPSSPSI